MLKLLEQIDRRTRYLDRAFPSLDDILDALIQKELDRLTPAQREKAFEDFRRELEEGRLTSSGTLNNSTAE